MYLVTVFQVDGSISQWMKKSRPTYNQMVEAVGGALQEVPYFAKYGGLRGVAYADEEGQIKNLPLNSAASVAWKATLDSKVPLRYEPRLYGPVMFIGRMPKDATPN